MEKDKKLIENLNTLFKSKKFMQSMMDEEEYMPSRIFSRMGKVLAYYIATRDENINYTFNDIKEKFDNLEFNDEQRKNIIDYGFMTHSFNGNKKDRIEKYGLNYIYQLDEAEKQELKDMRDSLNKLEEILGESEYLQKQELLMDLYNSQSVFLCSPGAKTFHYACRKSPERLYEGPLRNTEYELAIMGEKKSTHYLNILEERINGKYKESYEGEYEEEIEDAMYWAKKVVDQYCTSSPAFAMLNNSFLDNVQVCDGSYDSNIAHPLKNEIGHYLNFEEKSFFKNFFTQSGNDSPEYNSLDNLVTLAEFIPKDSISIVECMDEFELRQIYAKSKGIKIGEYINFENDSTKKYPTINELILIIKDCESLSDLQELNETYEKIKLIAKDQIREKSDILKEKYGEVSLDELQQELRERKIKLSKEEKVILDRDYDKKDGISTEYRLKDALDRINQFGLKNKLLENDKLLKEDNMQYDSNLHGVSHTRRVNFLATLIFSYNAYSGYDVFDFKENKIENLIKIIINNHDIGRVNDIEDKEHGANSVAILEQHPERLENLDDDEKEILKFVIKEHSLSAKENENDLNEVFKNKKQEELEKIISVNSNLRKAMDKKYAKEQKKWEKILNLCKDADKLDRVRLDPMGMFPEEGLDTGRLSLKISKKFENVAYEALDKVLRILDIENELEEIDRESDIIEDIQYFNKEQLKFSDFEKQMEEAQKVYKAKTENFLSEIVSERKLSDVTQIPVEIKSEFSKEQKQNEVEGIE